MDSLMQMSVYRKDEMEDRLVSELTRQVSEMSISPIMEFNPFLSERRYADMLQMIEQDAAQKAAENQLLMSEFLETAFSADVLSSRYVMEHLYECWDNVELITRVRENIDMFRGENAAKVRQKLEGVSEYVNAVRRALLENRLEIVELEEKEEETWRRRLVYLDNSMLPFYLARRRAKSAKRNGGEVPNEYREEVRETRVESSLRVLEEKLGISTFRERGMRSMQSYRDRTNKRGFALPGEEIRASAEEVQGKGEYLEAKVRSICFKLVDKMIEKSEVCTDDMFALCSLIARYVYQSRDAGANHRDAEKLALFLHVKEILVNLRKDGAYKCGKYAAILLGLLTELSNGYLEVPSDKINIVEDCNINLGYGRYSGIPVERYYEDGTNVPLFTHIPNIRDIVQGNLGDCYLLAGLISVVHLNPEEIMNIMRDNGDGTVTVCFKRREMREDGFSVYTPYYVTVRKTIPIDRQNERDTTSDAFSRGAFWVKMMEKAYVASGLHQAGRNNVVRRKMSDSVAVEAQLVDYHDICYGIPGRFISLLLGENYEEYGFPKNNTGYARIGDNRLVRSLDRTREEKNQFRMAAGRNVDSIGYETMGKLIRQSVQRFSISQKAASNHRNHLLHRINRRRSGMYHLDIGEAVEASERHIRRMRSRYYTPEELALYRRIDEALQEESYVTFGTKVFGGESTGMNGETESEGLVGGHAYTIIGTRRKRVKGREYLFLVVVNPWAYQGVVYDAEEGAIRKRADLLRNEKGVFLLDLETFARVGCLWYVV